MEICHPSPITTKLVYKPIKTIKGTSNSTKKKTAKNALYSFNTKYECYGYYRSVQSIEMSKFHYISRLVILLVMGCSTNNNNNNNTSYRCCNYSSVF